MPEGIEPGQDGVGDEEPAPASLAEISDLTLDELLAAAAEGLSGVTTADDGSIRTWSAGGQLFATLHDGAAEFRLDPTIAGAALRTPDTAPSSRGPGWLAFTPAALDDAATDRAEAWFLSAHRRAVSRR